MPTMPRCIIQVLSEFAVLFSRRVFCRVSVLLTGAILTPGRRTVANALRAVGLAASKGFQNYHRVLSRSRWSARHAARILLHLLIQTFCPEGVVVMGIDETLERRQGKKIAAKGIYRDPTRSSRSHLVKASGLRWVCLMLLAPIPWASRVWALPFFSVLAPSERYHQERGKPHKRLTDWARQMILQVRRWLPDRTLVIVADSAYAVLALLERCQRASVTWITRFRLDAALYEPPPPRTPSAKGRPRCKGNRLPRLKEVLDAPQTEWKRILLPRWYSQGERAVELVSGTALWYHAGTPSVSIRWVLVRDPEEKFEPQAFLCTDPSVEPEQILSWFILRWQLETTFQEVRTHLGVETQRQWKEQAILRTPSLFGRSSPVLLGLFSIVTLLAHQQERHGTLSIREAAWYRKPLPTFSDALASVRHRLWREMIFPTSLPQQDIEENQDLWMHCLAEALCYAA